MQPKSKQYLCSMFSRYFIRKSRGNSDNNLIKKKKKKICPYGITTNTSFDIFGSIQCQILLVVIETKIIAMLVFLSVYYIDIHFWYI